MAAHGAEFRSKVSGHVYTARGSPRMCQRKHGQQLGGRTGAQPSRPGRQGENGHGRRGRVGAMQQDVGTGSPHGKARSCMGSTVHTTWRVFHQETKHFGFQPV